MDITQVRTSLYSDEPVLEEDEEEMAVQEDYSGYVPPEVVVTSVTAAPTSPNRKQVYSRTKGSEKKGAIRPQSPTEVPVLVRGNLQKLGKRLKGWHQRYFEVQGSHLYYYKNHSKKDCLGEINLRNCYFCDATAAPTFGHPFELKTTERSHILAARTNDEMVQWVRTIRANMGTTAEEAAAKKSTKPKRWESFKNALSIQPKRSSAQPTAPKTSKKKQGKSFANKLKIRGQNRSRSPSPARDDPVMSSRPMSLTENDLQQDTLDILANVAPTRSLPATPLSTKRPVDFDNSPPDSPFLRASAASPALTLDSAASTPSHTSSVTTSPVHTQSELKEDTETIDQQVAKEPETPTEDDTVASEMTVPPITVVSVDESLPVKLVIQDPIPEPTVATVTETQPEMSMPLSDIDSKSSTPPVPDFLKTRCTWDDIKDLLDTCDDEGVRKNYDELPPEDPVWLQQSCGVEQLRGFLLTCP